MHSRRVFAVTALLVAACADPDRAPLGPAPVDRTPSFAISSPTEGGPAGFYFRPPIAAALAAYPGTFDATLLPTLTVKVCPSELGACTGADVVFDQSTKPAVTLDLAAQTYGVVWSPPATGAFRVRVYSGSTLLGFADVAVAANGSQLRDVPLGHVGTVRNASLPIRFRVEVGLVASLAVSPALGVAILGQQTVTFKATAIDLHGATIPNPSVSWSSSDPSAATVSAAGVATGVSEGSAIVTATSGGVSATAALTVVAVPADQYAVIGHSARFIPRADACGEFAGLTCESLVGDVVTDAMRATTGVDFAITNTGGQRNALTCPTADLANDYCPPFTPPPYPITVGQVRAVLPFSNRVVTLTVSGAELKTMLENGVSKMPAVDFRFAQVSGLCFTYDISAPAGSRVTGAVRQAADGSCSGAPVDLTAATKYAIAENTYMATGGDSYPNFTGRFTTHALLDLVVSAYVKATSPIAPTIQGRIACTTAGAPACPAVNP